MSDSDFTSPVPLHLQKSFTEYASTDRGAAYDTYVPVAPPGVKTSYNLDENRPNGNILFKRYPDGQLDLEYCKNIVIDVINKAKFLVPLTDLEKVILSIHFPGNFEYADPIIADKMRRVNLKITDQEIMIISVMVAAHLYQAVVRVAGLAAGGPGVGQ